MIDLKLGDNILATKHTVHVIDEDYREWVLRGPMRIAGCSDTEVVATVFGYPYGFSIPRHIAEEMRLEYIRWRTHRWN